MKLRKIEIINMKLIFLLIIITFLKEEGIVEGRIYQLQFKERIRPSGGLLLKLNNEEAIFNIIDQTEAGCLLDYTDFLLRNWCSQLKVEKDLCSYHHFNYEIDYNSNTTQCVSPSSYDCFLKVVQKNICSTQPITIPFLIIIIVCSSVVLATIIVIVKKIFDSRRRKYEAMHDPLEYSE